MAHDVFISYSSHDKNIADAICASLERNRIRCWIAPRDVLPGKEWGEAIVDAISACKVMVLIFSSSSNNSQQVLREVERAVNKNVVIVPFRIEPVVPTKSMEYFLYSTHWLDALTSDVEKHTDVLVDTVGKFIGSKVNTETVVQSKVVRPVNKKPAQKIKIALYAALGILIVGFGIYGMITAFTRPYPTVLNTPYASDLPGSLAEENDTEGALITPATPSGSHTDEPSAIMTSPEPGEQPGIDHRDAAAENPEIPIDQSGHSSSQDSQAQAEETTTPTLTPSEAKTKLKVGQTLLFGNYYGKPIEWTVIHINNEGKPLILTSNIVSLKSFDASESGAYNKVGDITFDNKKPRTEVYTSYSLEDMRAMKGSNSWEDSNIRQWLNSDQKKVSYSTQPPSVSAVWGGYNAYEKEMGFLYNFSEEEKTLIKKVKNKSVISVLDQDKAVGGSALYNFSRASLQEAWLNTDEAYYGYVEDKVFLLSVEEALSYIYDKGQLLKAFPTDEAKERDESSWYNDLKHQAGGAFMWWLRTPNANNPCEVCIVGTTGDIIYSDYAVLCGVGVRPACYLTTSELVVAGSGTTEDPYVLK